MKFNNLIFSFLILVASYSIKAGDSLIISFESTPESSGVLAYANFSFSADGAVSYQCKIDSEDFEDCTSPKLYLSLSEGPHQFSVKAIDDNNISGEPLDYNWTILDIFEEPNEDLLVSSVIPDFVDPNGWRGIFRINCDFSHSSYNDPIVYPGQLNRAHLHRFYGNTIIDHTTTTDSIISEGDSSCQGNKLNLSSYWVPALLAPYYINGIRVIDEFGEPAWIPVPAVVGEAVDVHEIFYYSASVDDIESIQALPVGLKMIAGDHSSTLGQEQDTSIVRWHCQSWESSDFANPNFSASIPECVAPDRVRMDIFFPSCWNGVDLDSADHKSHMAYPIDSGGVSGMVCPESHPIPVVRPSYHYAFGVKPDVYDPISQSSKGWRLASDMYEVDESNPGGFSLHGDWFNAWHPAIMQAILDYCIKGQLDCHDGNLANGFRLSNTRAGTQVEPSVINRGLGTGVAENGVDLWVRISNELNILEDNQIVQYQIEFGNESSIDSNNSQVHFQWPHQLINLSWSCSSNFGTNCPILSDIENNLAFNIQANEVVTFVVDGQINSPQESIITMQASITAENDLFDININNNSANDSDSMGIFKATFD